MAGRARLEGVSRSSRRSVAHDPLRGGESDQDPSARAAVAVCESVRWLAAASGTQPELAVRASAPHRGTISVKGPACEFALTPPAASAKPQAEERTAACGCAL